MTTEVQPQSDEVIIRIVAFTMTISVMSATMFNIALPELMEEYNLSLARVSWMTSAYLLVFAVGSVVYGKLTGMIKMKHLLTIGLTVFAVGSLIGMMAVNYWMILLGRVIQGAGAAVIPATSTIIPVRLFPPEKRGRALGIAMTGGAIGTAIGPAVAALVLSFLHWRILFCMPLLTLAALPYYYKYLKHDKVQEGSLDWIGVVMLSGTVAALLLAITNEEWLFIVVSIVLFLLLLVRIHVVKDPFIQPYMFASRKFTLGLLIAFLSTGIGYSLFFLTPQLLTDVNHMPSGMVGFVMIPAAVLTAFLGSKGGKIADVKGNATLFYLASALFMTCFLLLSTFAGFSAIWIAWLIIFGYIGQVFTYIAVSNEISRTLSKEQSGVGMGLLSMLNFISGAVFASLYAKVVEGNLEVSWNPFHHIPEAASYSNLYLMLLPLILSNAVLFYVLFVRKQAGHKVRSSLTQVKLK